MGGRRRRYSPPPPPPPPPPPVDWKAEATKAGWVPDWRATATTAGWSETASQKGTPTSTPASSSTPASAMSAAAPSTTSSAALVQAAPPPPPPPPEASTDVLATNNLSGMFLPQTYGGSRTQGSYLPTVQTPRTMAATPLTRVSTPQSQTTTQNPRVAAISNTNSVPYTPNTGVTNPAASAVQLANQPIGPKNQFQVPSANVVFGGY